MKTVVKSLFFFTLLLIGNFAFAQKIAYEVPKNYSFKTAEDYKKYDSMIVVTANWYQKLKMDQWPEKRVKADEFVMNWANGNPNIKIEIDPRIVTFTENNPHLLAIFVAGWGKYAITNPLDMNKIKGNMAGLKAVCKYYEFDINLNKDKQVEELIHLNKKNELRKWITAQLKAPAPEEKVEQ